jgi:hypothetical protein
LQLSTQNVSGFPFTALSRYFAPPPFAQADGSDTPISGTFTTIPQNHKFEANINGFDLAQQAQATNPSAQLSSTFIFLDAYPGTLAKGAVTVTPDLVGYGIGFGAAPLITTNGDLGTLFYGNPFPSTWQLFVGYQWTSFVPVFAPGAFGPASLLSLVIGDTPRLPTRTSPIRVLVGVPTNPLVNGADFFGNQGGVGVTPTLMWSAPVIGSATFYRVRVFLLTNSSGHTVSTNIAELRTQMTSLTMPPGLLSVGQAYVFQIIPTYMTGVNITKTPYHSGPTFASADIISGVMQP